MKDAIEIDRLKQLLAGRKQEYEMLGCTAEDKEQDNKIVNQIKQLENGG